MQKTDMYLGIQPLQKKYPMTDHYIYVFVCRTRSVICGTKLYQQDQALSYKVNGLDSKLIKTA